MTSAGKERAPREQTPVWFVLPSTPPMSFPGQQTCQVWLLSLCPSVPFSVFIGLYHYPISQMGVSSPRELLTHLGVIFFFPFLLKLWVGPFTTALDWMAAKGSRKLWCLQLLWCYNWNKNFSAVSGTVTVWGRLFFSFSKISNTKKPKWYNVYIVFLFLIFQ